jgi:hypothetical protein
VRKKERYLFEVEHFHGIFGTGPIFKSLESVVSLGEMSEGNKVLRLLIEGFAELGNTFSELVPEVEGTNWSHIWGRCFRRVCSFAAIRNREKNIQAFGCGWKNNYPLTPKHLR